MELYKEIVCKEIGRILVEHFESIQINYEELLYVTSVQALKKIHDIIENDSLSDFECVEKIIKVFESMGSAGGIRHDFG